MTVVTRTLFVPNKVVRRMIRSSTIFVLVSRTVGEAYQNALSLSDQTREQDQKKRVFEMPSVDTKEEDVLVKQYRLLLLKSYVVEEIVKAVSRKRQRE